jgi:hypothetical protein
MPFRLLARAAPFVLGAVAAAVWLRRRQPERPALPAKTGASAPPRGAAEAFAPAAEASAPAAEARPAARRGRFARPAGRRAVDIVTVVDDLLGAAR